MPTSQCSKAVLLEENERLRKRVAELETRPQARSKGEELSTELSPVDEYRQQELIEVKLPKEEIKEHRANLEEMVEEQTRELGERVKELECLYSVSSRTSIEDLSTEQLLQDIIELIPPGWQYPEITCARILLEDREFRTKNYEETAWKQTSDIVVHGEQIGSLEVGYLEEKPVADEGPFLNEERSLISAITEYLGRNIERIRTREVLQESEARFRDLATSFTEVFFAMDKELKYTFWNKASEELTGIMEKDAIGKSILELFPDNEDTRRALDVYREVLKTQKSQIFTTEYELKGKPFFFEISVYPTKDGVSVFTRDITDRKIMRIALEASEAKYRTLTENLNLGVYRTTPDSEGGFIEANPAVVEMFGYADREEYMATNVSDHYQDTRNRKKFSEKILRDGFVKNEELHLKKKDGTPIIASVSTVAVKDGKDNVQFYDGIIEDITQRKILENDLKQSEEKYRNLVENSKDSIILVDLDGRIQFANKISEELTGYSIEEGVGMNVKDIIPLKHWPTSFAALRKARKGEAVPYFESMIRKKDGSLVPVESGGQSLVRDGKIIGVQIITRDITERKKSEMALEQSRDRYRQLIDEAPYSIVTTDAAGTVTSWNKAASRFSGYTSKEVIGKHFSKLDFLQPKDIPRLRELLGSVLRGKILEPFVVKYNTKDGPPHFAEMSVSRLQVAGENTGFLVFGRDITERRQAEDALRESEAKYQDLYMSAPVAYLSIGTDSSIKTANRAASDFLGYGSEELTELISIDLYAEESKEKAKQLFAEFKRGIPLVNEEMVYERKDGQKAHGLLSVNPLEDKDGQVVQSLSIIVDITGQKQRERALRETQERYRELVEMAGVAIMIDDKEGDIIYFNDKFAELYGYSVEEMNEQSIETLIHPDDMERVGMYHRQRMEGLESPSGYEFKGLKKNGSVVYLEVDIVPLEEVIAGTRSYYWDVTHRKRAEELLKESEERFRAIFEQAAESFVLVDVETGNFVEFNDMAYENLGYERGEFAGLKIPDFEIIESAEEVEKHIKKIIEEGSDSFQTKHRTKDGYIRDIQVSSRALTLHGRKYIQSVWRDITGQKQAEEELQHSYQRLRMLSARIQSAREEDRSNIARAIHDELGQNLTAMKMDLSWLRGVLPPDRGELSDKVETILTLVDDTVQRVKRISAELRPGLLDDLGIAAAVEWQAEEFTEVSGIECKLIIEPEDLVMDNESSTAVFRVFQEILSNVARHSDASKVRVNLNAKSDWVTLEVSDNGRGIRKAEISSPTALGLLGMRERISHLGGEFDVTGRGGKGTKVRVRVPYTRKESA